MRPLGVLPRQHWVSRIIARERNDTTGYFIDKMIGGPFQQWEHTHRFFADGEQTILDDQVEYQLPGGRLGLECLYLDSLDLKQCFADDTGRRRLSSKTRRKIKTSHDVKTGIATANQNINTAMLSETALVRHITTNTIATGITPASWRSLI